MIRVLLVDDQAVVRRGLRARLQLEQDIEVVGEASSGSDALTLALTLIPDVAVIDVEMPELDGIETTKALRGIVPACAVVILSIHDDAQTRERAHIAGAVAFVEKRGGAEALLTAIRQAVAQAGESGE
jgi:two-component system response regulator DesR